VKKTQETQKFYNNPVNTPELGLTTPNSKEEDEWMAHHLCR
jgi:hypothetical protein